MSDGRGPLCPCRTQNTWLAFASLGFVLEVLISEKQLLSRGPDEFRRAIHAVEDLVLELHRVAPSVPQRGLPRWGSLVLAPVLLCVASHFLAVAFARQCLFGTTLVSGLQIKGVLLDIFDDIFLLHLPFEPPKSTFDRLAVLNLNFRHL